MTRDDIIKMAKKAKIEFMRFIGPGGESRLFISGSQSIEKIERLVRVAAGEEREACAKAIRGIDALHAAGLVDVVLDAIRSRGNP